MDKNFSHNKLLLMFFATFLFGEEAGYRFVNEITKTEIMDMEMTTDYDAGGFSYMSNFSGRILTEYVGIKDGTHSLKQTWSNIISTNRRNDELVINHKAQKLNGTQYTIIADSTGDFTREGVDDNSRQMEESNQAFMYFSSQGNILHPFGDDSLRHVGDTWAIVTKEHLEDFPGFESADADLNDKTVFTFDKIKKKKGQEKNLTLDLVKNDDFFLEVPNGVMRIGFAAETEEMLEHARAKLKAKNVDLIVANDVSRSDTGFAVDTNAVTLVSHDVETSVPLQSKTQIAEVILDRVEELLMGQGPEAPQKVVSEAAYRNSAP